ncbi:MAG: 5'-nucleotidase, partial [Acetobacterium sp.]|nr:5'-nucleotidase [Acetobacterium sp.]
NAGVAAGIIYTQHLAYDEATEIDQIRIAFDGDAVLFSDESEQIYKSQGLEAFQANEIKNAKNPLPEGPFAKFLKTLSAIQQAFDKSRAPIRTALVTARNAPAHERVIRTLRAWDVRIDEAFFLGGMSKQEVLKAFGAHIYFDDQAIHTDATAEFVPSARVPYKNNEVNKEQE